MTDPKKKYKDLMHHFDTAMFVTRGRDGAVRGRPMRIAQIEEDGSMWFVASKGGWTEELTEDAVAAVTLQNSRQYVSISGLATRVDDHEKLKSLWTEAMRPWFPEGTQSSDIVAIQFVAAEAEYWDVAGTNGLRYMYDAVKAIAKGERMPRRSEEEHGAVSV